MPSDKRQRQRENSRARQEAAAAAQKQSQQRSRIIIGAVGAIILGSAIFWANRGGDGGTDLASQSTTTIASDATTTTGAPAADAGDPTQCPPKEGTEKRFGTFATAPKKCIEDDVTYKALVKTDVGDYTIQLDQKIAPQTVNSFVFLARNRYFENVIFHRVIPGFMNQGGDPTGTGSGGPGYTIPDEFSPDHKFQVGDVAMAKTSAPNSGGSQFFVITGPQGESLPAEYTWFGKVISGMETVKKIEADGNADASSNGVPPKVTHKILSITITEG